MKVKATIWLNALVVFLILNLSLAACEKQDVSLHEPTENRLRERIISATDLFLGGRFDDFIRMRTVRVRNALFESPEDKRKGFNEWKLFLEREKPSMDLVDTTIKGLRAVAKMKGGVERKDRTRGENVMYDLWIFENGDWFLDTAGRTSPKDLAS